MQGGGSRLFSRGGGQGVVMGDGVVAGSRFLGVRYRVLSCLFYSLFYGVVRCFLFFIFFNFFLFSICFICFVWFYICINRFGLSLFLYLSFDHSTSPL